jgi:superfamily I DNA/RNA helicase
MLRAQEYLLGPRRLRDLGERTHRPYLVRAGVVLERYGDRLKRATMTDYEGVVQYALRLLNPGGRAAAEISSLYHHVLVDEFQDTNGSQMELLRRLMPGDRPNVFCVGDDAQSIYGFRGARIENVRDFEKVFPGTREIHLRSNYRSAAHIVSLAEQAISGDESRPARDPQAVASIANLGTVLHKVAASPREEGEWIADRIVELTQRQGVPREEIAILRRSLLDATPWSTLLLRGESLSTWPSPQAVPRPVTSLHCSPRPPRTPTTPTRPPQQTRWSHPCAASPPKPPAPCAPRQKQADALSSISSAPATPWPAFLNRSSSERGT